MEQPEKGARAAGRRRGIYILPNVFTSLNLFFGFHAIISAVEGRYAPAAVSIFIAVVFDVLDGKIARATRTTSRFGVEYDSLADLVSFGVAPGLMVYLWALRPLGRIGWLAAFLFVVCGALRLARYNTQVTRTPSEFFQGLPIPAGGSMVAAIVLFCERLAVTPGGAGQVLILLILYALAFLMVSTLRYNSFKKPELFRRMRFHVLVAGIIVFVSIAAHPPAALLFLSAAYAVSGPAMALMEKQRERHTDL